MNRRSNDRPGARRGFTFVEILAAMLFMAIVIPAAMHGLMLANQVSQRATRKRNVIDEADRLLNEAIVTESWLNGDATGTVDIDGIACNWRLTTTGWPADTMRQITVEIDYPVQGRTFTEKLTTLVDETTYEDSDSAGTEGSVS